MMAGVTRSHLRSHHAWLREGLGWEPPLFRLFSLLSFSGTDVTFLGERISQSPGAFWDSFNRQNSLRGKLGTGTPFYR